ncbi:MAG: tetratricopeptide repeat protein, partial [Rhodothermales bacterium]|nr:tetratricopeptide repeat protein [Rhodothermales bacterium]
VDAGDLDQAASASREALSILEEAFGERNRNTIQGMRNLARVLERKGDIRGSAALLARAIEHDRHPRHLSYLGFQEFLLGNPSVAEELYREMVAAYAKRVPLDSLRMMGEMVLFPWLFLSEGRVDEADSLLRGLQAYWEARPAGFASEMRLGQVYRGMASLRIAQDMPFEAGEFARRSEDLYQRLAPDITRRVGDHVATRLVGLSMAARAEALLLQGDAARAERLAERADSLVSSATGDHHWRSAEVRSILGEALVDRGRYDQATSLLTSSYRTLHESLSDKSPITRRARQRLIHFYEAQDRAVPDSLLVESDTGGSDR